MAGVSRKDQAIVRARNKEIAGQSKALAADLRRIYREWFKTLIEGIESNAIKKQRFEDFILPNSKGLRNFAPIQSSILASFKRRLRRVFAINLTPEFPSAIALASGQKDSLAAKFISQFGVSLAGFSQRDNKRVTKVLTNAVAQGHGVDRIFRDLKKLFDGLTRNRVKRIAEQTTATAQIVAQKKFWEEAAPQAAKRFRKIWLPSIGGQFDRQNHNVIKSVMFNTKFVVGAVKIQGKIRPGTRTRMDHPRDPEAPLEQILNCA